MHDVMAGVSPVTVIVENPETSEVITIISPWAELGVEDGFETLAYDDGGSIRRVSLGEIFVQEVGLVSAKTMPNAYTITARGTEEDDVVMATGFDGSYPLPISVISARLEGFDVADELEALVSNDGQVRTLLLSSNVGLFARYSSQWIALMDENAIDGLNAVAVQESAIDLYDAVDGAGQILMLESLPTINPDDKPTPTYEVGPTLTPALPVEPEQPLVTPAVVSSGMPKLPIINVPSDLTPEIIASAGDNDLLRWYVEKRARALDVDLPWTLRAAGTSTQKTTSNGGSSKEVGEQRTNKNGEKQGGGNPYHADDSGQFTDEGSKGGSKNDGANKKKKVSREPAVKKGDDKDLRKDDGTYKDDVLAFFGWFASLSDQEKADFEKAFGKGNDDKGFYQKRESAPRITEDDSPAVSPSGSKLKDFDAGPDGTVALYEDGSTFDGYGWRDKNGKTIDGPAAEKPDAPKKPVDPKAPNLEGNPRAGTPERVEREAYARTLIRPGGRVANEDETPIESPDGSEPAEFVAGPEGGVVLYRDGWTWDLTGWRDPKGKPSKKPNGRLATDD